MRFGEENYDDELTARRMAHHTPISSEELSDEKTNKILAMEGDISRLLQDNPFAPTG